MAPTWEVFWHVRGERRPLYLEQSEKEELGVWVSEDRVGFARHSKDLGFYSEQNEEQLQDFKHEF